jgi:CRP-like cAMP-binding protein
MSKPKQVKSTFDVEKYLRTAGVARNVVEYRTGQIMFAQGDSCRSVLYIQQGTVKLTITSAAGKEAIIAVLSAGDFF